MLNKIFAVQWGGKFTLQNYTVSSDFNTCHMSNIYKGILEHTGSILMDQYKCTTIYRCLVNAILIASRKWLRIKFIAVSKSC